MKKRWLLISVLVLAVGILAAPKLFLAPRLARLAADQLREYFSAEEVQVQLRLPWGWELFFGRIPGVEIVVWNGAVDQLALAKAEISGEEIRFEFPAFAQNGEFVYKSAGELRSKLTIEEMALNEIYWREVDPGRNLSISVVPEGLVLQGKVPFWNMELDIKLLGLLEVWRRSGVRLVLQNLEVEETRVPPFLLEVLNQNYDFVLDLDILPGPAEISGIHFERGQLVIQTEVVK